MIHRDAVDAQTIRNSITRVDRAVSKCINFHPKFLHILA